MTGLWCCCRASCCRRSCGCRHVFISDISLITGTVPLLSPITNTLSANLPQEAPNKRMNRKQYPKYFMFSVWDTIGIIASNSLSSWTCQFLDTIRGRGETLWGIISSISSISLYPFTLTFSGYCRLQYNPLQHHSFLPQYSHSPLHGNQIPALSTSFDYVGIRRQDSRFR